MTVTIFWRPKSDKAKHFSGATSTDLDVLKDAFGCEISEKDVYALRMMAKASRNEFYNEVADKIEQVGDIEFWGEW